MKIKLFPQKSQGWSGQTVNHEPWTDSVPVWLDKFLAATAEKVAGRNTWGTDRQYDRFKIK